MNVAVAIVAVFAAGIVAAVFGASLLSVVFGVALVLDSALA